MEVMDTTNTNTDPADHDTCESCGSDEGVFEDHLCYDCRADEAEWDANQDWD